MVNKGVSAVVYNTETQKFLLMRRSEENEYYPEIWQFPGGKLEDETPEEGALRELKEETGLEGNPVNEGVYNWISTHDEAEMKSYVFLVEVQETDVEKSWEHDEHRWVELEDMEGLETFEFIHKDLEAVDVL